MRAKVDYKVNEKEGGKWEKLHEEEQVCSKTDWEVQVQ